MKKLLLVAVNARYIHTNLAVRYLQQACKGCGTLAECMAFSLQDQVRMMCEAILLRKPDMVGFSCYIWNIEIIQKIIQTLKVVAPDMPILLGGPEVSYNPFDTLEMVHADYVLCGECEETLPQFLQAWEKGNEKQAGIRGLVWQGGGDDRLSYVDDLSKLPNPYENCNVEQFKNKIIYYETGRGCPFSCAFCLSGGTKGVRELPLFRVKKELSEFIAWGVKQVKLVDRTFNANPKRAYAIFEFIIEKGGNTNFHMEMAGDLINDDTLCLLEKAPEGLFQFEIGVQSTHEETLDAVSRKGDFLRLAQNVNKIKAMGNIHVHLDLIAGLPKEDMTSFARSFDDVYALHPDQLQLGFLKMLHGSKIRQTAEQYGGSYNPYAPYEVLQNDTISYAEICLLHRIADVLEKYYNANLCPNALSYLVAQGQSSFAFYEKLAQYLYHNDMLYAPKSEETWLKLLFDFGKQTDGALEIVFQNLMRYDYVCRGTRPKIPDFLDCAQENKVMLKKVRQQILKKQGQLVAFEIDVQQYIVNRQIQLGQHFIWFDRENGQLPETVLNKGQ